MRRPVFFSERIDAAITGKPNHEALTILADMIMEAQHDKLVGYGPPQHEIILAMRRYQSIYEDWIAERLPSTAKGTRACASL